MKTFLGIDPGMGGGMAYMKEDGDVIDVLDMPRTEYDIFNSMLKFNTYSDREKHSPPKGLIERVHSMPGQGIASAWKFSGNYHGCRMAMICTGISFDEVNPLQWQASLSIPKRGKTETKVQHKNKLKAKAQQLFPTVKVTLANADALLIAEYARRKGY